jgi:4-amino-4-deoxy-L-arabinose transferase-like glycosyltransferase
MANRAPGRARRQRSAPVPDRWVRRLRHHPSPVNTPTPALVTQRAAQRVPVVALLLLCAAYLLPGLVGRDPWKNADLSAFGAMWSIAEGRSSWMAPALGGLPVDGGLLPYWLGAGAIRLLSPWVDPALAARLPFVLLLALTLTLIWYTTCHLARTEAAQPVPFAFGGEAAAIDYSRAIADGALLAMIATLGLLQLGHETTPELAQLFSVALFQWALASAPYRHWRARLAPILALAAMADSGAPAMAAALGAAGAVICARSSYDAARRVAPWMIAAALVAVAVGVWSGGWAMRVGLSTDWRQAIETGRLLLWFCWPAWPLAVWTLWRWRRHLNHRHISVPLCPVLISVLTCVVMGGSDRALMLALPGLAVLAAFALPTLKRSTASAVDWFSVVFFTAAALFVWVMYAAIITGVPAKPAANVARLAPGFVATFSAASFVLALIATAAWIALVRWRTARHQHALWKSLLLPAGGVALSWLLAMTLLLPVLDYARSYRPLVARVQAYIPDGACVLAPGVSRSQIAALEVFGRYRVDASGQSACRHLALQGATAAAPDARWTLLARVNRPTDRREVLSLFVRQP